MSQASREFAYDQLHSMSFIQLFHLLVALANRTWLANLEEAAKGERWLPSLPVLAAGIRYNGGEALQQRLGVNGPRLRGATSTGESGRGSSAMKLPPARG